MKKTGKMIVCLIVLIVLLGVLILVTRMNQEETDQTEETDTIEVTNTEADTVTAVSFQINGQDVSFTKTDDTWAYDQDTAFPLSQTSIENIVSQVSSLSAEQVLEDDTLNLADYGLDQPTNVVTYTDENGTTKITIGNENTTTSIWYLYLNDDTSRIYLVSQGFDSMFPDDIMTFAEGETLPVITSSNITDIQVEYGDDSYQITMDTEESDWSITDASGFTHDADTTNVSTLTSTLASMSYGGMEEYNCSDMSQYGLAEPAATVRVHYTEEQTVEDSEDTSDSGESSDSSASSDSEDTSSSSSSSSESEEETTVTVEKDLVLLVGNQNEEGNYYVTMEGSKEVHTLSEDTVDSILNTEISSYWDLAVSPVTVSDITSLDVTYQGQTNTIARNTEETTDEDGNTTQTITYTWNGEEVDKTEASTLYSAATSMSAQSKDRSLEKTGEDEIVVVMHTADGDYTVSYSPYDSSFYYAEDLQGVPSLINKNNVNKLIDAYLTVIGEK